MVKDFAAMDDWQLLNEYATRNSQEAFRTVVERHAGMVYHTALRQLGNPHAAEEVTQGVFVALAQKAGRLPRQTVLCGWLFRATHFAALNLKRSEARRRRYEQQAMSPDSASAPEETESVWQQISPCLNDALDHLSDSEGDVVMTRFFAGKSHREVAQALGISEDTAKKRVSRALEKLRGFFARRGLAVPSLVLVAAFSAHAAPAAPAGLVNSVTAAALAHGAAGAGSALGLAKGILKFMAWMKAKTAFAVGAGVLLAAAGTATVALKAASSPLEDVITRLEHQSGKRIAWDKRLVLPATLDVSHGTFEEALDMLAVAAGAYWTIDYAVYDSDEALRQLLNALHEGAGLESGGWTNLSSMPLKPRVSVLPYDPHGRLRTFIRLPKDHPRDTVGMIVVLGPGAEPPSAGNPGLSLSELPGPGNGPPAGGPFKAVRQAMDEGVAEGVLAPERLLAETRLVPSMNALPPVPPTAEEAARLAKLAHAHWVTIYTLRPSPVPGAGIKLIHTGMESMYGPPTLPGTPEAMMGGMQSNRFNLSPEDRAAHQRAVEAFKKQQ